MYSAQAVQLPDVFDPAEIKLGHVLRNPLQPTLRKIAPSDEVLNQLTVSDGPITKGYHTIVSLDKRGSFMATFVNLLKLGLDGYHTEYIEVEADEMFVHSFVDADIALVKICKEPSVESWIKSFALHRKPVYFVMGLQVLQNAKFRRAVGSGASVEAYATLPLEPSTQFPVKLLSKLSRTTAGISEGTVSGVFGIKVLKGTWKVFEPNEEPLWAEKPHWKWAYETKGGGEEVNMGLSIEKMDENDLKALQEEIWAEEEEDDDD